MLKGNLKKWAVITMLCSLTLVGVAQQPEHGWAGEDPESRSGGCAYFTLVPDPTPPTCNDFEDGIASVIPSDGVGPYTYNWVGGPSTQSWTNVGAGTYTVIVFDQGQGGLPCNIDVFVNEPGPLTVFSMNAVAPTCFGACNGEAMPIVIGGNNGYTYEWDSGETGIMADELCNPFQLTITDSKGCVLDTTYTFDDAPEDVLITADSINVSCFGDSDGSLDITVSGGNPDYTFSWTGPAGFSSADEDIDNLEAGTYTVTVTDENDCEAEQTFEITAPEELELLADITDNPCAGDSVGAISVTPSGGTPDYAFSWTGPDGFNSGNQDISGLISGDYELVLTDENGCILTETFTVSEPATIEIELTITQITCNGANDGAVDATVTGGAGAFEFAWTGPNGFSETTQDIADLQPGSYTITATDSSGCSSEAVAEITEPDPLTIDGAVTDVSCNGSADGAITLLVEGGTPEYSFSWTGPGGFSAFDQDVSGLAAGTYTVEVMDENGCENAAVFEVNEPELIELTSDVTDNLCAGQSIGAIDLTISGGTEPFSFEWNGPGGFASSDQNISGLIQGSYTVEVSDENGCQQTAIYEVGESDPVELTLTPSLLTCPDDNDGAVDLEISGGTPDYNVEWTGPDGFSSTDQNISGLAQGVYVAEVTDANGCTATDATEVLALDTMVVSVETQPISCTDGSDGAISATVTGGTPDYSYSWTGPDGFTANTSDISGLTAGTYDLTVTDANDCETEISVDLPDAQPLELAADITNITCLGVYDGAIDLTVTGGTSPYSFEWTGPAGFTSSDEDISGVNLGNYAVLVTDSLGCTTNASYAIEAGEGVTAEAVVTDASCDANDNGSIEATVSGGTPGYSIFWLGPDGFTANTLNIYGLSAGTYTLFATDSEDCYVEVNFTVNNPSGIEITAEVTDLLCVGEAFGAIDATITGASGPITTVWSGPNGFSSTDEDIANLEAGDYTLTVIDTLDCLTEEVFTVNEPPALDLSMLATNPNCGLANGQIIAVVSGGTVSDDYTYLWTDESNNIIGSEDQVSNLGPGTYTVTVADDNGCSTSQAVELTESDLEIEGVVSDLNCNGDGNGSIEVTVTGGAPPYDFDWTGPNGFTSTDEDIFNLDGGDYTITVTDSLNCNIEETFNVLEPDSIEIVVNSSDISCNGLNDGSIAVTITGGTPPYDLGWQGPDGFTSADSVLENLAAGTYNLQLTDANNCSAEVSVDIDEPALIEVDADITAVLCSGQPEGSIDITISGGTTPFEIEWSGPEGFESDQQDISGLLAGDYTLVATDENGCVFAEVYTVSEQNPIDVQADVSPISCSGDSDGAIVISVNGGTPEYSYFWTGPDGFTANTADISGLAAGEYNLTVTDSNDCFTELTIDLPDALPVELSADIADITCLGVFDGVIDLTVTGGTAPYTYAWTGPSGFTSSDEDISGVNLGNYAVVVTDSLGCTANAAYEIEAGEGVMAEAVVTDASCDTNDDGSIEATVSGGTPGYSIFWLGPDGFTANTLNIYGLSAGTYTLYATDSEDCYVEANFTVNNPSAIEITADITHLLCAGDPTGAIDATISNTSGPITTIWSGPAGFSSADEDIVNLEAGNYTLTVIDSSNCITEELFVVNEPQELNLSLLATDPTCALNNGQITAVVSGGTVSDDYTYLWMDESNNIIGSSNQISDLGPGVYVVTVADDNGCSISDAVELTDTDLDIDATITHLACNGDENGSIEISVSGGVAPFDFDWIGPDDFTSTDENLFDLDGGSYTLTVTDSLNCSIEETFNVNVPDSIEIALIPTDPLCADDANGTILTNITGGTPGFDIQWTGPEGFSSTEQNLSDLAEGTYTIEVTDTNSCVASAEVTLIAPQPIDVIAEIEHVSCNGDTTGSIHLTIFGGTEDYILSWTGPNGFTADESEIDNLSAGTYDFNLVDANFCTFDTSFVITEPAVLELTATVEHITCSGENNGSVFIGVSGGTAPYNIDWSGPGGFVSDELLIDSLQPGDYQLLLSDSLGCIIDSIFTITEPTELTLDTDVVQPECLQANGEITAMVGGGTIPYSYQWENESGDVLSNDPELSGLTAGLYFIAVTDTNGCEISDWIALSDVGGEILADIENVSCFGGDDGAISTTVLNAIEPLDFAWSNPSGFSADTPDITNLTADFYNLLVTDSLGCIYVESFEITEPDSILIAPQVEGISCFGGDGAVSLAVSGGTSPYGFSWTGPEGFVADTAAISGLEAGDYSVTVTDSVGCTAEMTIPVTELDPLVLDFEASEVSCNGFNDGTLEAMVSGGQPDYSFTWIGPNGFTADTASIAGLEPGFYEVQVTDANGCVITDGIMITEPEALELVASAVNSTCGNDNGSAAVMVSGGTISGGYNYTWLDADSVIIDTTTSVENLSPGAYTIVVTDDNGCSATATVMVSDADGEITADVTPPSCAVGDDGAIAITVTGGTEPYTYSWSGPDGFVSVDQNIQDLLPGEYVVEVTDSAGCVFVELFELEVPETVELDFDVAQITCDGADDGAIEVNISGGLAPYDILWEGPNGFTSSDTLITDLVAGTYTVTVTDSALCATTESITIIDPPAIEAEINVNHNLCSDDTAGAITLEVSGGSEPYTFQWIGPNGFESEGQNLGGLASGVYEVLITDSMGCTAQFLTEVESTSAIEIDLTVTDIDCYGDSTGSIFTNVTGGTPAFTYEWTGPDGFISDEANIENLIAGDYQLTIVDSNTCTLMINTILTQSDSLFADASATMVSCFGAVDGSISSNISGGTAPYSYDWTGPDGFSDTTATISDLAPGNYQLSVTDSLGCSGGLEIEITEPEALDVSLQTLNDALCSTDNSGLIEIEVSGGTEPYEFLWTGPDGFISSEQNLEDLFPGEYELMVQDTNGCTASLTAVIDFTFEIEADAGADAALCENEQPYLLTGIPTNADSTWWADSEGNILSLSDSLEVLELTGEYTFYYHVSNGLCSDVDSVTVTIFALPDVDAGSAQVIVEGEEVTLGGNPTSTSAIDYLWTPNLSMNDSTITNPQDTPEVTTTYEVVVTDSNGCVNNDFTVVTVLPDIMVPSGVSPNGDGYNDGWIIDYIEQFPGNVVEVYNRWGDLLYHVEGYDNEEPWDGYYNGKLLPVGTYYYVIELNDERFPEPYTGPLTIFR